MASPNQNTPWGKPESRSRTENGLAEIGKLFQRGKQGCEAEKETNKTGIIPQSNTVTETFEGWPLKEISDGQSEATGNDNESEPTANSMDTEITETISEREKVEKGTLKAPQSHENNRGSHGGVAYEVLYPGTNAMLHIVLNADAGFLAESGAMVAMSDSVKLKGKVSGGLVSALLRKSLTKEKFFFQEFRAEKVSGEILLAPSMFGSIAVLEMGGGCEYAVQKDGFLGSTIGVSIDTKVQGLSKGMFSGEGFFVIKISGEGFAFINAFGSIHVIDIPAGRSFAIDNKHLVAWPVKSKYEIQVSAGIVSTFTSGEILVNRFHGPCRIYIQSRAPQAFSAWTRKILNLDDLLKAERKR